MILNPNIKARRLGYIKILLKFLTFDSGKHGFPSRFAEYAYQYGNNIKSYKDFHGRIYLDKDPRKSAIPYVKLAESLSLIEKKNKQHLIIEHYPFTGKTILFDFDQEEKNWFLDLLLRQDPIGFFLLFWMLSTETITYNLLKNRHDEIALDLVDRLPTNHFLIPTLHALAANTNNKLAKDSFLLPRLHWYYDLDLIQLEYRQTKSKTKWLSAISLVDTGHKIKEKIMKACAIIEGSSQGDFIEKVRMATK